MVDTLSKIQRSKNMASIRSINTKPELIVFRGLRKRKIYFQKHYKKLPGKPDIVIPCKKLAIFIDGDFWHGHQLKKLKKRLPRRFWINKIESNVKRDRLNRMKIKKAGWKFLRVWEHQIKKDPEETINRIVSFFLR